MTEDFRELHRSGCFVIPNPWDVGSALALQDLGFKALATTSSGFAMTMGRPDQSVTRDELVTHVAALAAAVSIPVSVDAEECYPNDRGGVAETVRLLAGAGASGCSLEDWDPHAKRLRTRDEAIAAVALAAEAARDTGMVLTARAENHLRGVQHLDDTIARLIAYRDAGAEVLYAPGLVDPADIRRVADEVGAPVNALLLPGAPCVDELAALGVRRISTGGGLARLSYETLRQNGRILLDGGTYWT
jgi:2-methylisocitrate lyase-like PEP mutase family enzyme